MKFVASRVPKKLGDRGRAPIRVTYVGDRRKVGPTEAVISDRIGAKYLSLRSGESAVLHPGQRGYDAIERHMPSLEREIDRVMRPLVGEYARTRAHLVRLGMPHPERAMMERLQPQA